MDSDETPQEVGGEAADWFVHMQADEISPEDPGQYVDWLRESPEHIGEMLRAAQVHEALRRFDGWDRVETDSAPSEEKIIALPPRHRVRRPQQAEHVAGVGSGRRIAFAAIAAAVVMLLLIVLPRMENQSLSTERGERREVVLSDGSILRMDPESSVTIKFVEHERHVHLIRGRALFQVAKNAARPFIVHADGTEIRVTGTAFGVARGKGALVVTVAEGKVAVVPHDSVEVAPVMLVADEQLTVPRDGAPSPVRKVNSRRELAWAEGVLIFDDDRLSTVVEEFNRYNRVRLRVPDRALANRTISGQFTASDPESLIAFLETAMPVQVVRKGHDITISGQPQASFESGAAGTSDQ